MREDDSVEFDLIQNRDPSVVDLGVRGALKVAHGMLRAYWKVTNPERGGVLVAAWYKGRILMVKNSYRKQHGLPGGYGRPGESAEQTGSRELHEECGTLIPPSQLELVYSGTHPFEGRRDAVRIVETRLGTPPPMVIDNREVIWAGFVTPEKALTMDLVPHLVSYLAQWAEREAAAKAE